VALKFDRSEPGVWVSGAVHAAILAAGLFAFASPKLPEAEEGIPVEIVTERAEEGFPASIIKEKAEEGFPVEIITEKEFAEIIRAQQKAEPIQPNADRVAE